MQKFIIILSLLYACCSCNKKIETSIDSIYVLFYNYSFEGIIPIGCDEITKTSSTMTEFVIVDAQGDSTGAFLNYQGVLDTTITDRSVLSAIEYELNTSKKDTLINLMDARISCFIRYKDGREERLCIGGYWAEYVAYNNCVVVTANKLLFLIKNAIGYYSWMGDNILNYSYELKDSTILRDSIIGYSGKKY